MKLRDKIDFCEGEGFWDTRAMEGIPSFRMSDGPHGLRKQVNKTDMLGLNQSIPAVCFPTAASTACSFDETLLQKVGHALGEEALANQVGLLLGPGANIKRNPLCGRSFEYFSEDPLLSGKMAAAMIRGIEETGCASSLKHFALNNQEYKRFSSDSLVDERTMHEIYLRSFEIAVKEGKPSTVMAAYNKVNGVHCTDDSYLLKEVLRKKWGFDGVVVTDWGAMGDRIEAFKAGCDLNMPGGAHYMREETMRAVRAGRLSEADIDDSVQRIRNLAERAEQAVSAEIHADYEAHHALACQAAVESAVLLKNEEDILPLGVGCDYAVLGCMAEALRYQGAGSSHINPWKLEQVRDILPDSVAYAPGYREDGSTDEKLLREAVETARRHDTAVIFAGLPEQYESEGFDRTDMKMPEGHVRLIEAVSKTNPHTVVVLLCGSAVEVPWADQVKGILYMGLPGEAGAEAIVRLLHGESSPSGRLAETWPLHYEDAISSSYYGTWNAQYREGLYVGYRYYSSAQVPVRFPFGYGLSYSTFACSDLRVDQKHVAVRVTNTGKRTAKEVVQLYVEAPKGSLYRPKRELKRFAKVELKPQETTEVTFELEDDCFAVYDHGSWSVPSGDYGIAVGRNAEEIVLHQVLHIEAQKIEEETVPSWYHTLQGIPTQADFEKLLGRKVYEPVQRKGSFTMENSIMEMKDHAWIMKLMYRFVEVFIGRGFKGKKDMNNPAYRMMMVSAADCAMRGMKICGGMHNQVFEGLVEMANGHFFRGLLKMLPGREKG